MTGDRTVAYSLCVVGDALWNACGSNVLGRIEFQDLLPVSDKAFLMVSFLVKYHVKWKTEYTV